MPLRRQQAQNVWASPRCKPPASTQHLHFPLCFSFRRADNIFDSDLALTIQLRAAHSIESAV